MTDVRRALPSAARRAVSEAEVVDETRADGDNSLTKQWATGLAPTGTAIGVYRMWPGAKWAPAMLHVAWHQCKPEAKWRDLGTHLSDICGVMDSWLGLTYVGELGVLI